MADRTETVDTERGDGRPRDDEVDKPTDVSGRGFVAALKRAGKEFSNDNCTDWAAALTYYAGPTRGRAGRAAAVARRADEEDKHPARRPKPAEAGG